MKSIAALLTNEIIINKSRFITFLFPCHDMNQFKNKLEELKTQYPDANHYCYGYKIGELEKAYDDGEPSKTAGAPILNVLNKQELDNTACIVIRYFGGIKLGAGGLVRAYSKSASESVKLASIKEIKLVDVYEIIFEYAYITLVESTLKRYNVAIKEKLFQEQVIFHCYIKDNKQLQALIDSTSNNIVIKKHSQEYKEGEV